MSSSYSPQDDEWMDHGTPSCLKSTCRRIVWGWKEGANGRKTTHGWKSIRGVSWVMMCIILHPTRSLLSLDRNLIEEYVLLWVSRVLTKNNTLSFSLFFSFYPSSLMIIIVILTVTHSVESRTWKMRQETRHLILIISITIILYYVLLLLCMYMFFGQTPVHISCHKTK